MLPPEIRTTQVNRANRCFVHGCHVSFCLVAGLQAFYAFTHWGECFLPVIRFYSNYFILNFFFTLAPMFFFKGAIEIYDDDDDDNEAQH